MMAACQNCAACLRHCPTGAISSERFLLHAERCLVFHNERPGDVPFPDWIDPAWHNCLEGCMHCQWICPENKRFRDWVEDKEEFSEEETELILRGGPPERLSKETIGKLERLDILGRMPPRIRLVILPPGWDPPVSPPRVSWLQRLRATWRGRHRTAPRAA